MTRTTKSRRGAAAAAALIAVGLAAAGCSANGDDKQASGGGADTTLVAYTGQAGDYQVNFNPFSPSRIGGLGTIYEPMFFFNKAEVSDPVPLLATESAWNDDGTQLSVTLREGVTWSDGEAFTADDVVFTFQLMLDHPAINSSGFNGTAEAVDDTHVVFTFESPSFVKGPDVLGAPIVPEHLWKSIDPEKDVVENPIGTGAFVLEGFKPQAYTYAANPDYWGEVPAVDHVRFVALSGNQAGADGIAAGTIDWFTGPIPDIQNTHSQFPDYDHFTQWQSQMVLATCSSADMGCTGPQTDPAVRQAIYYAINRDQLNSLAFEGTAGQVSPTFALTPGQDSFVGSDIEEPVAPAAADPARSGQILEDAGWSKGSDGIYQKDGKPLSLTVEVVTGWTDYITAIDTLKSQLADAGIELNAAQSSWNEWTDKKVNGNFELAIDSLWQGPSPDPFYVYTYFFDSASGAKVGEAAGNNFSRFSDPEVDKAIDELELLDPTDTAARQPYFDTIQSAIVEDMPYVPVLTGGTTSVWNTADFAGWPSEGDLYAFPAVWSSFDAAEILKRIQPVD